jgi:sodium-dependent phosphate cotransporter
MIMGANVGTTITNTIVALGHARRTEEFRRAFTAATMHDAFNIMTVAVLFPLEVATGALASAAEGVTSFLSRGEGLGARFESPIKTAVDWLADVIQGALEWLIPNATTLAVITLLVGVALIFSTLALITRNMRVLVAARIERSLNAALARSGLVGMVVGVLVTVAVQSSSITTSILIPLVASGVIVVRHAYPITLGANIGTTITALLAALGAGAIDGLTIAVTHTLFNVVGILLFYSIPALRELPIRLAEAVTGVAVEHKALAVVGLACVFVVIPTAGIVLL